MYEYTTGKDVLGNKLTKEQQQASLFQLFGIAAVGVLASKASTQLVGKGTQAVTKKFSDMRNVIRTSKVTQYGKDIQQAMRNMPAAGIDKAKKMYDAVLDTKVPRFLSQEAPVGVSSDFAQQTVRDMLKSTAKDTMCFMEKGYFDGKRWRDLDGRFIKNPNPVHKVDKPLEMQEDVNKKKDFDKDVINTYTAVQYEGTTKVDGEVRDISRRVYQRSDINWNQVDSESGLTNLELMRKGRPPYWKDGTKIELHHSIQLEPGPMIELPASLHDEYSRILHGLVENGGSFRNNPSLEKQYNNFRTKYWRWRAKQVDHNL
jgi:toxin YxiD